MGNKVKNTHNFIDRMKLNEKFTLMILVLVFVPITGFTILFFHNMELNTINEGYKALEFSLERSYDEIVKNVDNINMSTQFFLSDRSLTEYLERVKSNRYISEEEKADFYNVNISALKRMVNSNPYLHQVRVYVDSKGMEEMTPIVYRYAKMQRLPWAMDEDITGWKYDYLDMTEDVDSMNPEQKLMALVTPIVDYSGGQLGMLEVAVDMEVMFPAFVARNESTVTCFIDGQGGLHCADEHKAFMAEYLQGNTAVKEALQSIGSPALKYQKWKGDPMLEGSLYVREMNGTLVCVNNLSDEIGELRHNRNLFLFVLVLISMALTFFVNFVVMRLLSRFYIILQSIREVQSGDLSVVIPSQGKDEMAELGTQINKMMERIRVLMQDNLNRELLVKNAEIRSLQNQINAHFIYNVLESIKMMAEIDEKYDISDAVTSLGKLLRYSMHWTSGKVTVGEELEYVKNYLALINLRFDYEIYLSVNLPEIILHQEIPKMSLQPIIENSIYHGIEQIAEDTNIYLKGMVEKGECIIEITDCGKGMTEEQVELLHQKINGHIEKEDGSTNGIGLKNVQDRIRINYGDEYGITISSRLGCYTKVRMTVPQTYFGVD